MVEFYYHDNNDTPENFTESHNSGEEVPHAELERIGVFYRHCPTIDQLNTIAKERNYKNRDEITLNLDSFGGDLDAYNAKMKQFYKEHYHEDEEIRYIVEGEGYFDVRNKNDRWIRAKLDPEDLLVLPAGIYHRFTLTDGAKHVKAIRLFKDEPKWEALNRGEQAESEVRHAYVESIA
ncbi:acireductone dioxygenase [Diutina catenulata]